MRASSWRVLDVADSAQESRETYVLDRVVGHTDGAGLGLGELGHGLPGVDDGDAVVNVAVTALDVAAGLEGEELLAGLEGDGPVDEVQVEVVELELGKTLVEGLLNDIGVVLAVPELGGLMGLGAAPLVREEGT
jgi:hypothetical protein